MAGPAFLSCQWWHLLLPQQSFAFATSMCVMRLVDKTHSQHTTSWHGQAGSACVALLYGSCSTALADRQLGTIPCCYSCLREVSVAVVSGVTSVKASGPINRSCPSTRQSPDMNPVQQFPCFEASLATVMCWQVVFALVAPGRVVPNLVAGAIAEAGAQQAGDMMQDFKAAHLLSVSPRAQFLAMLVGSGASVFVSVVAYELYTAAWPLFGPELPAPTARIWLDMASLVRC